ncbi:MAG: hypothetical protein PG978_001278 [Wolbachia endosymbiont of Ctenocephalides felis wCfeF]|nr:MAG: hypothetical protein PG978_001278 [Wolbachia endosymbiont of Ctenocephalides felis wCfeF]
MKMKRLCALAVLLTSSLASAAGDVVANLEGQYYAGLNFGAGWGGGFIMKPSIVFGYHHDKNSKFELEVLSNVKSLKSIGASLLANYRFYPDLDIDPVKLYVSGGLGGYLQIVPFGFGGGSKKAAFNSNAAAIAATDGGNGDNGGDTGNNGGEKSDDIDDQIEDIKNLVKLGKGLEELAKQQRLLKDLEEIGDDLDGIEKARKRIKDLEEIMKEIGGGIDTVNLSLADKILGSISYKLKVGVDYEITPQIVGAVGITMGGQLSSLKALKIPDAVLELGVRYNF